MSYTPTSKGQVNAVAQKSAAYTLTINDYAVDVTCSTANIAITLPAATGSGRQFVVKKVDATAFLVNLTPNGTDTIDQVNAAVAIGVQNQSATVEDIAAGKWDII